VNAPDPAHQEQCVRPFAVRSASGMARRSISKSWWGTRRCATWAGAIRTRTRLPVPARSCGVLCLAVRRLLRRRRARDAPARELLWRLDHDQYRRPLQGRAGDDALVTAPAARQTRMRAAGHGGMRRDLAHRLVEGSGRASGGSSRAAGGRGRFEDGDHRGGRAWISRTPCTCSAATGRLPS
jgi:hypothetical protein